VAKLNLSGNIPVIGMPNGKVLTQSYAILRHWDRLLGAYDENTGQMLFAILLLIVGHLFPCGEGNLLIETKREHFSL
jgi:hypothetical protein